MADLEEAGPVDESVLTEQHLHRSSFITTEGYRGVQFVEHGRKLNQWDMDHPAVLDLLRQSGFYGISRLRRLQLDQSLLGALVERWRRETQTFHFRHGEMTITLQDVAVISGLRVDGAPVTGTTQHPWIEICQELLGVVPDGIRAGQIRLDWIYQHFHHIHLDAPAGLVAATARAYMLYQIGCSLFPNPTGYRVHLKWLPLLADFDACGGLAWGSAALAYLYRALGTASLKDKVECCCFATLVQIWAWDHLHVGRPTGVGAIADMADCPLGCRWTNAGGLRFGANVRTTDIEFYRDELDQQRETQITWRPYTDAVLEVLPAFCVQGSEVWRSRTTLICFHIVELHVPDRVLRQFGLLQHIPIHVETIRRFTSQGRPDEHWGHFHAAHIERWGQRLQSIIDQHLIVGDDPVQATSIYMEWYWQITRRWISRPVQRPPLTYQPRGQTERALVDAIRQTQYSIRSLVHDRPSYEAMIDVLTGIDIDLDSVLEYIPTIPVATDIRGRDFGHASTSGHHHRQTPTSAGSPSPSDVADIPAAPERFPTRPLDLDLLLPPPVSRDHFTFVYSRRHAASSSQARPTSRPATIEEIQAIPEHREGVMIADLDAMADIEPIDDIPIADLVVEGGRRRGRGRARGRGRGRRGRGRSRG
ncbi:protein MAIN-LIKE 1-like [Ananas comosus]|uniref:Protein MAIN-LIKE 1-like n=1 Tax=Ananas comosus TaxID=4615 RepID=A0A6P5GRK9_ANACO|nr:protein MAIN-LIKE 1-like [Ananas comosus]